MKSILKKVIEAFSWIWIRLVAATLFLIICSTVLGAIAFVLTLVNVWFAPFFAVCAIVHFGVIVFTIIFAVLFAICDILNKGAIKNK